MRPSPDKDAPFTGYGADFGGANQALRSRPHIPMSHKDRVGARAGPLRGPAARPRRVKIDPCRVTSGRWPRANSAVGELSERGLPSAHDRGGTPLKGGTR